MGEDVDRVEAQVSTLEHVDAETAETIRGVLGRRAPDLLRALETTGSPSMAIREQVNDVLGDEVIGEISGPEWEPTPHGRRVERALERFLVVFQITEPAMGTDQWPPDPDLRGDRAGSP